MKIIIIYNCDECNTEMEYKIVTLNNKLPLSYKLPIHFTCPKCGLKHVGLKHGTIDINVFNY